MKGNKMSAILAILLMLSGALFVPRAFAQVPADAVESSPLTINWTYPAHAPGETFNLYIDVINVVDLFSFQAGFRFNPTALQVVSVAEGGFLSNNGADLTLSFPGYIDNVGGVVGAYGWSLTDTTKAKTGSGHLLAVVMRINPALWPPYTNGFPGGPVSMADLTDTNMDPTELILMHKDGASEITPLTANIRDGTFTLSVSPANPVAFFTYLPVTVYKDEVVHFDASGSTQGWNGYANVPIVNYHWDFGDGTIVDDVDALIDHTFTWVSPPDIMTFTVTLTVTDADGRSSAPFSRDITAQVRPTGAAIDLQTQRWRYQDPTLIVDPFFGEGLHVAADLFRPGEWVQLFAYVSYNGDGVQAQLIAYEVHDNNDNIVLTGTAITNADGWALYEFRIPWPCDPPGPTSLFGTWSAIVTWEVGDMSGIPYAKTINDTITFQVGWGIWIKDIDTTDEFGVHKGDFFKSELVYVKIHIQNDYMMARLATITAVIYDDLMVPINTPAVLTDYNLMPGQSYVLMVGIHLEKWAFVGTGTAKANAFTKLPFLSGISWCPEVTTTFIIKKTP